MRSFSCRAFIHSRFCETLKSDFLKSLRPKNKENPVSPGCEEEEGVGFIIRLCRVDKLLLEAEIG